MHRLYFLITQWHNTEIIIAAHKYPHLDIFYMWAKWHDEEVETDGKSSSTTVPHTPPAHTAAKWMKIRQRFMMLRKSQELSAVWSEQSCAAPRLLWPLSWFLNRPHPASVQSKTIREWVMIDQELTRPPNPSSGRGQTIWQVTKKIYIVVAHFSIYLLLFLSEQKHFTDELNKHYVNLQKLSNTK